MAHNLAAMTLTPHTRIGPYEIISLLGSGGMGEVYRAQDTSLQREVALKVLPDSLAADGATMARFEREAQLLASLNHPHIAAIYGLEGSGATRALVMELVEGPTLADRIRQGPLALDEALPIARQIAEALEAAHERGIIHRDLKPANIKVRPDGAVKILDFGLAKAVAGDPASSDIHNSPTISAIATKAGAILGTAAYMSPEQAKAKPLDKRTDIWSFGCVFYEMLTAKKAFGGDTVTDTLAAILRSEPDWDLLPHETPQPIRGLLKRCLQKEQRLRLRDIGDARLEIEEALAHPQLVSASTPLSRLSHGRTAWAIAAILLLCLLAVAIRAWFRHPQPSTPPIARFEISIPAPDQLVALNSVAIAISPDGTRLAYVARHAGVPMLFIRALDQANAFPVAGSEGANTPFFSPDGNWVGFFPAGRLKKVAASGGAPVTVTNLPTTRGASWGPRGTIALTLTPATALSVVSADGGVAAPLSKLDLAKGEASHRWPQFLPDGDTILFTVGKSKNWDDAEIQLQSLKTGERRTLIQGGTCARYVPTGNLLYGHGGKLLSVPFDLRRLQVTGPPVTILDDVTEDAESGAVQFAASDNGTLVYLPGGLQRTEHSLLWIDHAGQASEIAAPPRAYWAPRISPDGTQIATVVAGANDEIWVNDILRNTWTRLTFESSNAMPTWSADGKRVAFAGNLAGVQGIFWKLADGSGDEQLVLQSKSITSALPMPLSWSPDGKTLAYDNFEPQAGHRIWLYSPGSADPPRLFINSAVNEDGARFSPNGRWVAYASEESGRFEVYVQPFAGSGGKWQISRDGGSQPVWTRNGKELFFYGNGKMMSVDVNTDGEFSAGNPNTLFEANFDFRGSYVPAYDVTPDGKKFIAVRSSNSNPVPASIQVILNWFAEINQRKAQK
jgi:serine/threonine protein kinase/Tol biopolymer transport system component